MLPMSSEREIEPQNRDSLYQRWQAKNVKICPFLHQNENMSFKQLNKKIAFYTSNGNENSKVKLCAFSCEYNKWVRVGGMETGMECKTGSFGCCGLL